MGAAGRKKKPRRVRVSHVRLGLEDLYVVSVPWTTLSDSADVLTPAEQEVAERMLRGQSNVEIGAARGSSPRTVANQIAAIFRKLDVSSRAELVAKVAGLD